MYRDFITFEVYFLKLLSFELGLSVRCNSCYIASCCQYLFLIILIQKSSLSIYQVLSFSIRWLFVYSEEPKEDPGLQSQMNILVV